MTKEISYLNISQDISNMQTSGMSAAMSWARANNSVDIPTRKVHDISHANSPHFLLYSVNRKPTKSTIKL